MEIITLDFETFYGTDYTLTKMTTEDYVRSIRGSTPCWCQSKLAKDTRKWFTGNVKQTGEWLRQFNIPGNALLCHNMSFDGLILQLPLRDRTQGVSGYEADGAGKNQALDGQRSLAKLSRVRKPRVHEGRRSGRTCSAALERPSQRRSLESMRVLLQRYGIDTRAISGISRRTSRGRN